MSAIEHYNLERPTHEHLLASLEQVMPEPEIEQVLFSARRELKLGSLPMAELSSPQLLSLTEQLTRERGLISIVARSFAIRLNSYVELSGGERHV